MNNNTIAQFHSTPAKLALSFLIFLIIFLFCSIETFAREVSFTWSSNPEEVTGYKLYYKKDGEAVAPYNGTDAADGASPIDVGNTTAYTITGLDDNATYHFVLTAYNETAESEYTEPLSITASTPPIDSPPTLTIVSPSSNTSSEDGTAVTFEATATDLEDGDLSELVNWTSDIDGDLGYGSSITTSSLSTGTHTITASVTDSNAQSEIDTIAITIEDSSGLTQEYDLENLTFTTAYSSQGNGDTVITEEGGTTYAMTSNDWAKTNDVYTITADSILVFEFLSTEEGEIHGIGFDEDGTLSNDKRIFQLFGSQIWSGAIQVNPRYTTSDIGTWVQFAIPIGTYYTGDNLQLVLANDNDATTSNGTSLFRNIQITDQYQAETPPDPSFAFEVMDVNINHSWQTVDFEMSYQDPVVIAGPLSFIGFDPSTVRLRNVTGKGFEIRLQEWDYLDSWHAAETVSLIVMEKGTYTLDDGSKVQAGYFSASSALQTVDLHEQFDTTPVIVEQVVSYNDSAAVTGRLSNITNSSFRYQLQNQELDKTDHTTEETIHYIAWEQGSGSIGDVSYEVATTPDSVTQDWFTIYFQENSTGTPPLFIGNMQTTDGGDTATVRYQGLNSHNVQVKIEEETSRDSEVSHTTEVLGFISIN